MSDLRTWRNELATEVSGFLDIRVHPWPTEQIHPPCGIVMPGGRSPYLERTDTFCGARVNWLLLLLTGTHYGESGFDMLDDWVDALYSQVSKFTVGGVALQVGAVDPPGLVRIGGTDYLSVEFPITGEPQ